MAGEGRASPLYSSTSAATFMLTMWSGSLTAPLSAFELSVERDAAHIPFVTRSSYPLRGGNQVTPLVDGEPAFRRICEALEAARASAWVTVAFLERGVQMPDGRGSFFDVLDRAVGRGVDVRVIFWRHTRGIAEDWSEARSISRDQLKDIKDDVYTALRFLLQILIAFTAIFGVAMSIVFGTPEAVNDDNYKATGLQTAVGFLGCLTAAYFGALVPLLLLIARVRRAYRELAIADTESKKQGHS